MDQENFQIIRENIINRRTTKATAMNGEVVPDAHVNQLLELADWAPTHGRTEPWRFFIYKGISLQKFGKTHATMYWEHTPEEKRNLATFEKQEHNVDKASHLIICVMKRGENPKISVLDEIAATCTAIQNLLLGAHALNISAFWSTGGMTHHSEMKRYLQLHDDDIVLGLIYLGYADEPAKPGTRKIPLADKVKWM